MRGVPGIAIVIGAGAAAAACTSEPGVTFTIDVTVERASTEIRIDGTIVDGGGAVPRALSVSYAYPSWLDAGAAPPDRVEDLGNGSKIGELVLAPGSCADVAGAVVEISRLAVSAAGAIAVTCTACTDAGGGIVGGTCP